MRLITVSQRQPEWIAAGEREYARRLPREWSFEVVELKPAGRGRNAVAERLRAEEAERIRGAIGKLGSNPRVVALDEVGVGWSSQRLADNLGSWLHDGRDLALVIGGADGLEPALLQAADHRWSLSAATLPHGLVRIVVAEQLYRASTLLAGHPYHRA